MECFPRDFFHYDIGRWMSTVKKANFLVLHLFFRALLSGRVKKAARRATIDERTEEFVIECHLPSFRTSSFLYSLFYIHFSSPQSRSDRIEKYSTINWLLINFSSYNETIKFSKISNIFIRIQQFECKILDYFQYT